MYEPLSDEAKLQLKHIEEISVNARGTWFALTATLLFSAIAVAGVQDKDFFTYDTALTLPIINFSVPIDSFFRAAPVIVLGLFVYLHLYLVKLWRSLGRLGSNFLGDECSDLGKSRKLDEIVFPWLISDAAILFLKSSSLSVRGVITVLIVGLLLWGAGPAVLGYFWWRSFVPHDVWLSFWVGSFFALGVLSSMLSLANFFYEIRQGWDPTKPNCVSKFNCSVAFGFTVCVGVASTFALVWEISLQRTSAHDFQSAGDCSDTVNDNLVSVDLFGFVNVPVRSANLYNAEVVQRPKDWIPHDEAEARFLSQYSGEKQKDLTGKETWIGAAKEAFDKEQKARRDSSRSQNFECWNMRELFAPEAFLLGAKMRKVDGRGAIFLSAIMEGADLRQANLEDAKLRFAKLQTTILWDANLKDANFEKAQLTRADLSKSDLSGAKLRKANLTGVNATNAKFNRAVMEKIIAAEAQFVCAELDGADLSSAEFHNANLFGAILTGTTTDKASFDGALVASADLSSANLTEAQRNSSFGDRGTKLPKGVLMPGHWPKEILTREEAEQRWREWQNVQAVSDHAVIKKEGALTKQQHVPCRRNLAVQYAEPN